MVFTCRRGSLYPWKRGLFAKDGIDHYNARIELLVELDPTDIVFGFYSYRETDVVFRALDVNPFTNPDVKNRVIKFYFKNNGSDCLPPGVFIMSRKKALARGREGPRLWSLLVAQLHGDVQSGDDSHDPLCPRVRRTYPVQPGAKALQFYDYRLFCVVHRGDSPVC